MRGGYARAGSIDRRTHSTQRDHPPVHPAANNDNTGFPFPKADRLAYGFIQKTLDLTGGNLTTHLRKLEDADYLVITKEFLNSKPRTWVQATPAGRRAFAEYLSNLEKALNWQPRT